MSENFMLWLRLQSLLLLLCKRLCDAYVYTDEEVKREAAYEHWMGLRAIVHKLEEKHSINRKDYGEIAETVLWMKRNDLQQGDICMRVVPLAEKMLDVHITMGVA